MSDKAQVTATAYTISAGFARTKNILTHFVGVTQIETERALKVYGRGSIHAPSSCLICGRGLTHPVSQVLGIGPECGQHFYGVDVTKEEIEAVRSKIVSTIIDCWIPKSCILETSPTNEIVELPETKTASPETRPKKENTASMAEGKIKIQFSYDASLLAKIKSLSGRRWNNDGKFWTVPISQDSITCLQEWGFKLDENLLKVTEKYSVPIEEMKEIEIPELLHPLRPFQKKGVAFLESRKGRGLIADPMGLGKTVQALGWLQKHPEARPAIIICPASLKYNWANEIKKFMGKRNVYILAGSPKGNTPLQIHRADSAENTEDVGNIIIMNYDIAAKWAKSLKAISPKTIILDECHFIKNAKAQRTKAVKAICKNVPHLIALSGTPIVNRPIEMYNTISLIDPDLFPSWWAYAQRYCGAKHTGFGWDFSGATNSTELHEKLIRSIMIRRKKEEVLPELPAKIKTVVPFECSTKNYQAALSYMQEWRKGTYTSVIKDINGEVVRTEQRSNTENPAQAMVQIEKIKAAAALDKFESALGWIEDYLETNDKLVVFATHKEIIGKLMEELSKYNPVKVDGSMSSEDRQEAVNNFQNQESCKVFIGNIKAAGVGLTLTASSATCFVELGWTPGEHEQAEDRVHRIGQKADSVNAYYLIAKNTIEEEIAELLDEKAKVLAKVLDGEEAQTTNLLSKLIGILKGGDK